MTVIFMLHIENMPGNKPKPKIRHGDRQMPDNI